MVSCLILPRKSSGHAKDNPGCPCVCLVIPASRPRGPSPVFLPITPGGPGHSPKLARSHRASHAYLVPSSAGAGHTCPPCPHSSHGSAEATHEAAGTLECQPVLVWRDVGRLGAPTKEGCTPASGWGQGSDVLPKSRPGTEGGSVGSAAGKQASSTPGEGAPGAQGPQKWVGLVSKEGHGHPRPQRTSSCSSLLGSCWEKLGVTPSPAPGTQTRVAGPMSQCNANFQGGCLCIEHVLSIWTWCVGQVASPEAGRCPGGRKGGGWQEEWLQGHRWHRPRRLQAVAL